MPNEIHRRVVARRQIDSRHGSYLLRPGLRMKTIQKTVVMTALLSLMSACLSPKDSPYCREEQTKANDCSFLVGVGQGLSCGRNSSTTEQHLTCMAAAYALGTAICLFTLPKDCGGLKEQ